MRELNLNGYIDDEVWFGDEITPETLHESLYGADNQYADDVHIRLNSYGGSCNAATRMFDDIRAYPGNVQITVSGTAASAATVLSMAADKLEMTPGSLWMIHDPSIVAIGNERDLMDSINLLRACKESILNVYCKRCRRRREDIADMMTATTWMDAQSALDSGFIDAITEDIKSGFPQNADAPHVVDRADAEKQVQAWFDRHTPHKPQLSRPVQGDDHTSAVAPASRRRASNLRFEPSAVGEADLRIQGFATLSQAELPEDTGGTAPPASPEETQPPQDTPAVSNLPEPTGTPVAQLRKRLGLLMPAKRA